MPADVRATVLFVSVWSLLGGGQKSLLTLLRSLPDSVDAVLAAPAAGPLIDQVREHTAVTEHVVIPAPETRRSRLRASASLGRWLITHRRRVQAVHVNGDAELKLLLPWLVFAPRVVVWYHSGEMSRSTARLAAAIRTFGRRVVWAPVSDAARHDLVTARLVPDARDAVIVPNPIDPDEVRPLARVRAPTDQLVVGYLGGEEVAKGILVLAEIAERLDGAPVRLVVVTKERPRDRNPLAVNDALDRLRALRTFVEFYRRDHDVRNIYAQIDALLVPSLRESFCRVAAEAMANGLPVVASDLPALRELIGADESGLLFPTGNAQAAAHAVGRLAHDRELRSTLARAGERRVAAFTPDRVAGQFLQLYGLDAMVL